MAKKKNNQTMQSSNKAVILARVSTREQENGQSIDAQVNKIRDYCLKHNLNVAKEFIIVESSTRGERKKFYEMLNYVKQSSGKIIIVADCVDRMQRSFNEHPILDKMRKEDKIEMHFVRDNQIIGKNANSSQKMFWNMCIVMAQSYTDCSSDNVTRSMNYNRAKGIWQSLAPIGYLNENINGKKTIVLDEKRAPIIKMVFEEYATGMHSIYSITELAKRMGLSNKRHNKPIRRSTIYDMLKKPFYCGYMEYDNKLIPHIYEPIISKAIFDKVQIQLSGKKSIHAKRAYSTIPFAFRGLVRCKTCGCTITSEQHTNKSGKVYKYLRCNHINDNCNQGIVNENVLLTQLNEEIFDKSMNIPNAKLDLIKSSVKKYLANEIDRAAIYKRNITNKLKELSEAQELLTRRYGLGKLKESIYEKEYERLELEIAETEKMSDKYVEIDNNMRETIENVVEIASRASILMKSSEPEQKRELLGLILKDVVLDGKKLTYKLQKPFDKLFSQPYKNDWINATSEDLSSLSALSNDIEQFKKHL